jgi:hypothetical protein
MLDRDPDQIGGSRKAKLVLHLSAIVRHGFVAKADRVSFRDAAEWQSSGGLQLKQGGIDESARARAECALEPIPPRPGLAVGRICFRQIRVDIPQPRSTQRTKCRP